MQRILLVEDSDEIQFIIQSLLGKEYLLTYAGSVEEAHRALENGRFDLILLDVNLPDGNGFEICAKLRTLAETRSVPVIFLTGRSATSEKVVGFSLGADDYVTKPFDPLELKARVLARLTRASESRASNEWLLKRDLRFHLPSMAVTVVSGEDERRLALTGLEFRLLHYLAKHEDIVLSREQLLNEVWGNAVHVHDRAVDGHMSALRKQLRGSSFTIKAIYGEGYVFELKKSKSSGRRAA